MKTKGATTAHGITALALPEPPRPQVSTKGPLFADGQDPSNKRASIDPRPPLAGHGGRQLAAAALMIQGCAAATPALTITSARPLVFDAPFGEGEDRQEGVRAASALVKLGSAYVIAQDDANFAAVWRDGKVEPLRLFAPAPEDTFSSARGNKAKKPDLELGASFDVGGRPAAVLFGSGSTDQRTRAAWIVETPDGLAVRTADLRSLYDAACQRVGIPASALNLEAAAASDGKVTFFQRGNGEGAVNATFSVSTQALEAALLEGRPIGAMDLREVRRHALGTLGGSPLGFSDAAPLPDGRILFVAAAEASPNTYDDGAVAGSVIGILGLDGQAEVLHRVPEGERGPYKLEGLAIEEIEGNVVHLRAVEDADDPERPSTMLALRLVLPD